MTRKKISSNTEWETTVGYSRAVRIGPLTEVSGTTAVDEEGKVVGPGDIYVQTKYILAKIGMALAGAGTAIEDVIRTRIYVTDISQWEAVGRAHGETFGDIKPVATMVEVKALISHELLVEIEATAYSE